MLLYIILIMISYVTTNFSFDYFKGSLQEHRAYKNLEAAHDKKLIEAIYNKDLAAAKQLLSKGAHANFDNNKPLINVFIAIFKKEDESLRYEFIKLLVNHGADITFSNSYNPNFLSRAIKTNEIGLLTFLLQHIENPPSNLIQIAIKNSPLALPTLLNSKKFKWGSLEKESKDFLLTQALYTMDPQRMEQLLTMGLNPNADIYDHIGVLRQGLPQQKNVATILDVICANKNDLNFKKMLALLITYGIDLTSEGTNNPDVLTAAIEKNDNDFIELVLNHIKIITPAAVQTALTRNNIPLLKQLYTSGKIKDSNLRKTVHHHIEEAKITQEFINRLQQSSSAGQPSTPRQSFESNDPYIILGVLKTAPLEDITKAYRTLMLANHPDKGGSNERAQKLNAAYKALKEMHRA